MATFGTTDESGTSPAASAGYLGATKYTLSEDGTVTKISIYSPDNVNHKGGIYSDNAGVPDTLLVSNETGVSGSGWKDISLDQTFLSAGVYWLAFNADGNNCAVYKAGGTNQRAYKELTYGTAFPSTFSPAGYQNYDYPSYGTYTTGTNMQVNIGGTPKIVSAIQVNVGGNWKNVSGKQVNVNNTWKNI